MSPINHDYRDIHIFMGIPNIESQMARNNLIFSFKTVNNLTFCSEILGRFNFRVPTRSLRYSQQYFELSNYMKLCPNMKLLLLDFLRYVISILIWEIYFMILLSRIKKLT